MERYFELQYLKELVGIGAIIGMIVVGVLYFAGSAVKDWFNKHF